MGLLRKAALTADRGETATVGQAAAPSKKPAHNAHGLLRRSLSSLRTTKPPAQSAPPLAIELAEREAPARVAEQQTPVNAAAQAEAGRPLEDVLEEVLTAIASLRGGVELPSRLFTALTTLLGVRKGALLLYDPVRLVYAPWASLGYDQTTLHRMRIPPGANDTWNALANGRPIALAGGPAVVPFRQYFSARELSGIGRLLLAPFIAEERLIAVLLATEIDSPLAAEDDLIACLARAAEAGAPRMREARAAHAAASVSAGTRSESLTLKDEPTRFVESIAASRRTVLLLSLSLEEYSKSVLKTHEHLDPFRLHEDLGYFLGSFLSDIGKVLSLRQGRFIFALPDFDASTLDLFFHQLFLFLQRLFDATGTQADGVGPRVVRSASWPADGSDLGSLVESLSS